MIPATVELIMTKRVFKVGLDNNIEGIITWKDILVYYIGRNKE
jgi:hypothetical protein